MNDNFIIFLCSLGSYLFSQYWLKNIWNSENISPLWLKLISAERGTQGVVPSLRDESEFDKSVLDVGRLDRSCRNYCPQYQILKAKWFIAASAFFYGIDINTEWPIKLLSGGRTSFQGSKTQWEHNKSWCNILYYFSSFISGWEWWSN